MKPFPKEYAWSEAFFVHLREPISGCSGRKGLREGNKIREENRRQDFSREEARAGRVARAEPQSESICWSDLTLVAEREDLNVERARGREGGER